MLLLILVILTIISILTSLYIFLYFPNKLNEKIKNSLFEIYKPINYYEFDKIIIFKLNEKPDNNNKQILLDRIKLKYGLNLKFETIDLINQGIIEISFYRNDRKYSDLENFYCYWNIENSEKIIDSDKINSVKIIVDNPPEKKPIKKQEIKAEYFSFKKELAKKKEDKKNKNIIKTETIKNIEKVKISIVIDDVGYEYLSFNSFTKLQFPITFAIIPGLKDSKKYYDLLKNKNYEIILHIPMEPIKGKQFVEKNGLFIDLSELEIRKRITNYFNEYPKAFGANNHMGSKAVTDEKLMTILMEELNNKNKFWLDSMTNEKTLAPEIAKIKNVKYFERSVFLDNQKDYFSIKKSMDRLYFEAKNKKFAVGIGHAQTFELARVLKEFYNLNKEQVEFVNLKDQIK